MKAITIVYFLLALTLCTACTNSKDKGGSPAKAETTKEAAEPVKDNPDNVELTDEQMKAIGIELGHIEPRGINSTFKVNGVLEVPNQFKAKVTSSFNGIVRTLNIVPGSMVHKGQSIATIVNPDLVNMQQQYLTVNTKINLAKLEYDRQKALVTGNAGARKNLQQAESELKTLDTEKDALYTQLSTLGISPESVASGAITSSLAVRAPVTGTVSKVNAEIGTYTDANTVIAEIVNNDQLQVKLFMYEKDLPKIHLNQTIRFNLTNNPAREHQALINAIGTAFEDGSTTIAVRAAVSGDKKGMIEGMNVSAMVNVGNVVVPSLPDEAIVTYQGQDYIFVQVSEPGETNKPAEKPAKSSNTAAEANEQKEPRLSFKRVKVVKGASNMGYTEIKLLDEISPKAKVITKGAFFAMGKMTNAGEEGE
ncbi:efflux RND transporter periplasmic adaptor subunit [Mucilaginibacter sp.]|uniref:efflux RND transporter periplasmic adaptor subunit n=1 Tax=Mucilaginibacter sp. TaxID=1882438 RepID=UPI000CB3F6F6|nr:efflux RND transporter periplasmic adaptor subunit [Mucilaginibacter sp.]PLW88722.1 MAG: efflux RND transporter periplasmic adaptor subunit [Mucilaginibacter sp.]PMP65670.1 MAG: efflux RND transporter periplasmic adaptor subunit [Mucilaginibacter sp.]HEK21809.1 efflux RND transporter periplasmic adaptor subunit [Bacteroidota bacterium]